MGGRTRRKGFTVVELLVTIVVIGIIATVATLAVGAIQADSRDATRKHNLEAVASRLEVFYEKNGEYPSCQALTGSAAGVAQGVLGGVATSLLRAPKAAAGITNSFVCQPDPSGLGDQYVYEGFPAGCQTTSQSCMSWVIRYKTEANKATAEIASLHTPAPLNLAFTSPVRLLNMPPSSLAQTGFTQVSINAMDRSPVFSVTSSTPSYGQFTIDARTGRLTVRIPSAIKPPVVYSVTIKATVEEQSISQVFEVGYGVDDEVSPPRPQ